MNRLVKYIIGLSVGLLLATSVSNAQTQLGAADINGNLEVTGTFTFGGGIVTLLVSGDSLATVEFLRTLIGTLSEPLITVSDTVALIKDQNDNIYEGVLVEVTENSADLIITPGSGWPSLVSNNMGYYYNTDSASWFHLMNSYDSVMTITKMDYTTTP